MAGATPTSFALAWTCSTWDIPTNAAVIPGDDLTNCRARSASFSRPRACATNDGKFRATCPCSSDALATSVIPKLACSFHNGAVTPADGLIAKGQRFRHSKIERELYETEVVFFAGDVRGDLREFGELHGVARFGFLAEAVPGGHAVELNFAGVDGGLEKNEMRRERALENPGGRLQ